jgi:hypothetical protein
MADSNGSAAVEQTQVELATPVEDPNQAVSTHVLISQEQVLRLRELSRRTRVAQSEYLREAVDDLLVKYGCLPREPKE